MKPPEGATAISRAGFSPDGRWIVYAANLSDGTFAYVTPFPVGAGGHRKIANDVVNNPVWNRDEIFNISNGSLRALGIRTQPALDWMNPTTLFQVQGVTAAGGGSTNFDVTRDGKQILQVVLAAEASNESQEIHVALNWTEELKRLAP